MINEDNAVEEFVADPSSASAVFRAFISKSPYEVIIENIELQFDDYINNRDTTDWIEFFLDNYFHSYDYWKENGGVEEDPEEFLNVLDSLYRDFFITIQELFAMRIGIRITSLENGEIYTEENRNVVKELYRFFVLKARENIRNIVSTHMFESIIETINKFDDKTPELVRDIFIDRFDEYSPYLTIDCSRYLSLGDTFIEGCFQNFDFSGNFLRKYTPKFYENKDLFDECINSVIEKLEVALKD